MNQSALATFRQGKTNLSNHMNPTIETKRGETADYVTPTEYLTPEVNIFETRDGYVLEAEMPGVNKEGLEITIEDNELAILGKRAPHTASGEALLRERVALDFRRVFELDPAIDASKISAKMEQGVLTLTLPKSERVKPRKITVTS
jgi:HSP20 family protein